MFDDLPVQVPELGVPIGMLLVRSGDLRGIQIGGRNQWRVERTALEEYIAEAYRKSADTLKDLPPDPTDPE